MNIRTLILPVLSVLFLLPHLPAAEKVLDHGADRKEGVQSNSDGAGHVVAFDAPRGTWYVKSVLIFGARYGGNYDPAKTLFSISLCDKTMSELAAVSSPFTLFAPGRYDWVEIPIDEPVKVPKTFKIAALFSPTATKGVFVAWSKTEESHSSYGAPGGRERATAPDREWMIRVKLTSKKPKKKGRQKTSAATKKTAPSKSNLYRKDFEFLQKTVKRSYPALAKKEIDWNRVCKEWEPRFRKSRDDETHLLNAHRLLACLGDSHTNITRTTVEVHVPSFDSLYGGGLWIAVERGRILLRALMENHHLHYKIKPGAELLRIEGRPAGIVHDETHRRVREWSGWSSGHFLDSCLSFRFFTMEKDLVEAEFLNPDGKVETVRVPRMGPGNRGISRAAVTLPEGIEGEGLALSGRLGDRIGYIRIRGSMNSATEKDFFRAFDALEGVAAVILDCRGMGGGGDGPAWSMAGRFYSKSTPLGTSGSLDPTGNWQFDGPVVMLQDEREISSAETFTWAMTETGRALSVGRPTGGATIIPRVFDAPSGLFSFRMGCSDRATPIRGIKPEGNGTQPDVFVPYEPVLLARHRDPTLAVARDILCLLLDGAPRDIVVGYYGGLLGADAGRFRKAAAPFGKLELPAKKSGFADVTAGYAAAAIDWEIALCGHRRNPMPDFAGASERLEALAAIAAALGDGKAAARAKTAPSEWKEEILAQKAFGALLKNGSPPASKSLRAFLKKHGKSRYGRAAAEGFKTAGR
jgi:carboxyl-terminal processing protease